MLDVQLAERITRLWQRLARMPHLDLPLLLMLLLLAGTGLAVLYAAADGNMSLFLRQALRLGVGFAVLLALARVPPSWLLRAAPWFYLVTLLLLAFVLLLGEGRGAARWLSLGPLRFQPSELAKLAVPIMLAWYLHRERLPPGWIALLVVALLIGLPALMIARQPDLGTAVLVGISGLFVVFLAGISWWRILGMGAVLAALLPVAWQYLHEYQRNRIRMLLDPEADPLGHGWNIIQSKIAVGSGGLWGKGWQQGTQSRLEFLPEHTTDFIFAVYAEEFGLIGVALLLLLYALIIGRGMWLAMQGSDTFGRLLGGAVCLAFFTYVAVNAGMISGLLPVVGVPMPLLSYGGTSAVTLLAGFGILMSVYGHRRQSMGLR
jgi:rod shape determining protein RodA